MIEGTGNWPFNCIFTRTNLTQFGDCSLEPSGQVPTSWI